MPTFAFGDNITYFARNRKHAGAIVVGASKGRFRVVLRAVPRSSTGAYLVHRCVVWARAGFHDCPPCSPPSAPLATKWLRNAPVACGGTRAILRFHIRQGICASLLARGAALFLVGLLGLPTTSDELSAGVDGDGFEVGTIDFAPPRHILQIDAWANVIRNHCHALAETRLLIAF